ncbi:hypothetical protein [Roseivirga pacifica]|uniref:hypothetical protein n=1 Tax=Roseivirga pacifica TaxID=1267423 RepID=UPI00227ADA6A|nr:hypothetical protein [Roseivirga pacifica]
MNSSEVKSSSKNSRTKVKNLSAILAICLAVITLFQAGTANSKDERKMSALEIELLTEIDEMFATQEDLSLEEVIIEEVEALTETNKVKVYDANGKLLGEGDPKTNESLRQLVNKADFLNEYAGSSFYQVTQ